LYANAIKKVENLMLPLLKYIRKIGQGQLIRRQISNLLQFGCQLDAHLLYEALDTFNHGLLKEVHQHASQPDKPIPDANNPVFFETTVLLEASGLDDPLQKIYVTSQPLEGLPVLLLLFLLAYLPKVSDPRYTILLPLDSPDSPLFFSFFSLFSSWITIRTLVL
jgi:WASH complex subunit strumpellin